MVRVIQDGHLFCLHFTFWSDVFLQYKTIFALVLCIDKDRKWNRNLALILTTMFLNWLEWGPCPLINNAQCSQRDMCYFKSGNSILAFKARWCVEYRKVVLQNTSKNTLICNTSKTIIPWNTVHYSRFHPLTKKCTIACNVWVKHLAVT